MFFFFFSHPFEVHPIPPEPEPPVIGTSQTNVGGGRYRGPTTHRDYIIRRRKRTPILPDVVPIPAHDVIVRAGGASPFDLPIPPERDLSVIPEHMWLRDMAFKAPVPRREPAATRSAARARPATAFPVESSQEDDLMKLLKSKVH